MVSAGSFLAWDPGRLQSRAMVPHRGIRTRGGDGSPAPRETVRSPVWKDAASNRRVQPHCHADDSARELLERWLPTPGACVRQSQTRVPGSSSWKSVRGCCWEFFARELEGELHDHARPGSRSFEPDDRPDLRPRGPAGSTLFGPTTPPPCDWVGTYSTSVARLRRRQVTRGHADRQLWRAARGMARPS
jgi:hypothetical protein